MNIREWYIDIMFLFMLYYFHNYYIFNNRYFCSRKEESCG